jgi:N-methylhydantoinase B/oxoprolinase/acetone carboxylase alpha subunit
VGRTLAARHLPQAGPSGEVFLLNDPSHGGNHLPDLIVFVPVSDGDRAAMAGPAQLESGAL